MKKHILFILCLVCIATACTQASDECQYIIDNRLSEDVEVQYVCRRFQPDNICVTPWNGPICDTIPAHQIKTLPTDMYNIGGSPSDGFSYFSVCTLNHDTIFFWTEQEDRDAMDKAWVYGTEVVDKTRYWRHFIHKSILIIEE